MMLVDFSPPQIAEVERFGTSFVHRAIKTEAIIRYLTS